MTLLQHDKATYACKLTQPTCVLCKRGVATPAMYSIEEKMLGYIHIQSNCTCLLKDK